MTVQFEALFAPFASAAVGRLGYIYPKLRFSVQNLSVVVEGESAEGPQVRRDVLYQLYREKIYQDGLISRTLMHRALLS